jgi:hypothetical protein
MSLRDNLQKKYGFDPHSIVDMEFQDGYVLRRFLKGEQGKRGFAYEALCEATNHHVCCKLYFNEMLDDSSDWSQEFTKPNRVQSDDIAHYVAHGTWDCRGIKFTWISYLWIDGVNLGKFIEAHPEKLTVDFVRLLAEWILGPLHKIKQAGSIHGDIHMGNILVAEGDDQDVPPGKLSFKLIDFGISASIAGLSPRDDYKATAIVLAQLLKRIRDGELGFEERFCYDQLCQHYLKLLEEPEPDRHASYRNPSLLYRELGAIWEESKKVGKQNGADLVRLRNPFELLSADRFREDSPLLHKLFSKSVPGYGFLESEDTVVITGPRGCGKTMALRNMALKTFLSDQHLKLDGLPAYFGFYMHSFELWIAFPRSRKDNDVSPERIATDDFQRKTLHYFHLCLLEEVFSALEQLVRRFGNDVVPPERVYKIADFINSNLRRYQAIPGDNPLSDLKSTVTSWRAEYRRRPIAHLANEDAGFVRDFCRCLRSAIPLLKDRKIFFLLDDYNLGKLTPALQLSLNRVIFQRLPDFEFKIAAEKKAILLKDVDGTLDPSRSHFELDIGYFFTTPESPEERLNFLREVFNNRLTNADNVLYTDITQILGETQYRSFKEFAEVLARKRRPRAGGVSEVLRTPLYHGVQHLSEICSGDVAAMISLLQQILIKANFDLGSEYPLPLRPKIQDAAIKDYSRMFLEHIGGEQEMSNEARDVAKAFGEMAQWKLKNQASRNEGVETRFQASRLEVYEDSQMDGESARLYDRLLRVGVFIQEPRGFAQGETTSRRLYYRRLFLPTFGLSFSRRDCIRLHMKDFVFLLRNPARAKGTFIDRWKKRIKKDQKPDSKSQMVLAGLEEDYEFD